MNKKNIRLKKGEELDVRTAANALATVLIGRHGIRRALVIGRLVHQKIFANYKNLQKKYGEIPS